MARSPARHSSNNARRWKSRGLPHALWHRLHKAYSRFIPVYWEKSGARVASQQLLIRSSPPMRKRVWSPGSFPSPLHTASSSRLVPDWALQFTLRSCCVQCDSNTPRLKIAKNVEDRRGDGRLGGDGFQNHGLVEFLPRAIGLLAEVRHLHRQRGRTLPPQPQPREGWWGQRARGLVHPRPRAGEGAAGPGTHPAWEDPGRVLLPGTQGRLRGALWASSIRAPFTFLPLIRRRVSGGREPLGASSKSPGRQALGRPWLFPEGGGELSLPHGHLVRPGCLRVLLLQHPFPGEAVLRLGCLQHLLGGSPAVGAGVRCLGLRAAAPVLCPPAPAALRGFAGVAPWDPRVLLRKPLELLLQVFPVVNRPATRSWFIQSRLDVAGGQVDEVQ